MKLLRTKTQLLATILLIGDSHTYQSFGRRLDARLRTLPQTAVASFASWGTSPAGWLEGAGGGTPFFEHDPDGRLVDVQSGGTPHFSELLAKYQPTLTIIALGANLFGAPPEYSAETVHQMAAAVGQRQSACLWVGPPDSRERAGPPMDELYGILRGASMPYCQFVDSRVWTHYPATGGDGLHYDYLGPAGLEQTARWAQGVFDRVRDGSGLPDVFK